MQAPLIIVSGPSGSGKSTLIKRVVARWPDRLRLAVSATTRPMRPGEEDGTDYFFWTPERFEKEKAEGAFVEWAVVHGKHFYGTPRSEVDAYREKGVGVFLDIDVQGAETVRAQYPDHLSVFVTLSRFELFRERLTGRGTETSESIERRLKTAEAELARSGEYHYKVINDDLGAATAELIGLIRGRYPGWLPG